MTNLFTKKLCSFCHSQARTPRPIVLLHFIRTRLLALANDVPYLFPRSDPVSVKVSSNLSIFHDSNFSIYIMVGFESGLDDCVFVALVRQNAANSVLSNYRWEDLFKQPVERSHLIVHGDFEVEMKGLDKSSR